MTRKEALEFINALIAIREDATDAQASKASYLYPTLKENSEFLPAGTRINWKGTIKRVAVDLWDTEENNPDNAPILWEDIDYNKGYRIIPETITVGTAFVKDECGWWNNTLYKSLIDNNVWTPDAYPAGWEIIE